MSLIEKLLLEDFTLITPPSLPKLKNKWSKLLGFTPKNSLILEALLDLEKQGKFVLSSEEKAMLRTRNVRSDSGVIPLAVMMKPYPCPGQCIYCPQEAGMPKSYFSDEPAAARAKSQNFDPVKQVRFRLRQLKLTGHSTSKVELIVVGGTYSAYPDAYKLEFIKSLYDTCNGKKSSSVEAAQDLNTSAKHRIVGLSIETRPDWITPEELILLRRLGVTKVQLGVQALDAGILKNIHRGHSLDATTQATRLLRNAGLKICYHFMPNLPGSSPHKDLNMAKMMYTDPRFIPDSVKIYPCAVIPGTPLEDLYRIGKFKSYPDVRFISLLTKIKLLTPPTIRIDRLVRDISKKWIVSGTLFSNMRQMIQAKMKRDGLVCRCIRCREIKGGSFARPTMLRLEYDTLGGREIFLSYEKDGHLFSLLRLRLPLLDFHPLFPELEKAAIIREIHTFGTTVGVTSQDDTKTQHRGLGKSLMEKAERIAKARRYQKIAVISASGTREYYTKLGYSLEGCYMTKNL